MNDQEIEAEVDNIFAYIRRMNVNHENQYFKTILFDLIKFVHAKGYDEGYSDGRGIY